MRDPRHGCYGVISQFLLLFLDHKLGGGGGGAGGSDGKVFLEVERRGVATTCWNIKKKMEEEKRFSISVRFTLPAFSNSKKKKRKKKKCKNQTNFS